MNIESKQFYEIIKEVNQQISSLVHYYVDAQIINSFSKPERNQVWSHISEELKELLNKKERTELL